MSEFPLEEAELVAKRGMSEALKKKVCQSCGCNPEWSMDHPRLYENNVHLQNQLRKARADHDWQRFLTDKANREKSVAHAWMQKKVKNQQQALARLYIEVQHLRSELNRKENQCATQTSSVNSTPEET